MVDLVPAAGHGDGSGRRRETRRRHPREQPLAPKWVTGEGPPLPLTLAGKAAAKQAAADLRGEWEGGSPFSETHRETERRRQQAGSLWTAGRQFVGE